MSLKELHTKKTETLLKERLYLLDRCNNNKELQRYCIARAKQEPIWFFNMFLTTYNPRENPSIIPFILYDKQDELINWLECRLSKGEWGILEKSRYIGATVICCAYALHKWIFNYNISCSVASRKAELVDKLGNPDCLMEKIVMMLERLPVWMTPLYERKLMLLRNIDNGSVIRGESGDGVGRGGRSTFVLIDEFAFIERSELTINALSENSDCCIFVSTPNGMGGEFARMRHSGAYPVFTYHWRDDPRRSEEWYEEQKLKFSEVTIAQELDISYTGSVEGSCIKDVWVRAAVDAVDKIEGLREYNKSAPRVAGLDIATTGTNNTVLMIRQGNIVNKIESWNGLDTTQSTFKVDLIMRQECIEKLNFDVCGVGAGVAGTLNSMSKLPYDYNPINSGESPTDEYISAEERTKKDKYLNLRAQMWGDLATRFKATWEVVQGIREHPLEDLISIPNNPDLISELSQPKIGFTVNGKMKLESKIDLQKRGVKSPDYADALALDFHSTGIDFGWWDSL